MRKVVTCPESLLEKYRKNHNIDTMKFFSAVKLTADDVGKKFKMKAKVFYLEGRIDEKTLIIRCDDDNTLWAVDQFQVQKSLRENAV